MRKVYLDTNVMKFAIEKSERLVPMASSANSKSIVYKMFNILMHDKVKNQEELYFEIKLLSQIAALAKANEIALCRQLEALFELLGLPGLIGRKTNIFEGIKIGGAKAPIEYERLLMGIGFNYKILQVDFLKSIKNERFCRLQKITGAYQGKDNFNRNQLLDAFHLWCAEYNNCDYFLTLDFKLLKYVEKQPNTNLKVKLVKPSQLIEEIKKIH